MDERQMDGCPEADRVAPPILLGDLARDLWTREGDGAMGGIMVLKQREYESTRAMRGKKAPNRKNGSALGRSALGAPEARAGGRRARRGAGARYNVTSIRNEHDANFDAQRDRAQVRRAIARGRARARLDVDGLGRAGGSGSHVYPSARGECARREEPRERRRSPVELDTDENDFFLEAEPRTRSAARARPGESTHRSRGSIRSRKVSRVRSCGTIARRNARWRENAREYGSAFRWGITSGRDPPFDAR